MSLDLQRDLGRVEGKLDGVAATLVALSTTLAARDLATDTRLEAANERINHIERKLYWMTGVGAVLAILITKVDFTQLFSVAATAAKVTHP